MGYSHLGGLMKFFRKLLTPLLLLAFFVEPSHAAVLLKDGQVTRAKLASGAFAKSLIVSATSTHSMVAANTDILELSGASFTVTLPTAVGITGYSVTIVHLGTSLTQVYTLATTSSQTVGGLASGVYQLWTNGETLVLYSDGSNWKIRSHQTPSKWTAYTMSVGGLGTVTSEGTWWRRNQATIELQGTVVSGTAAASNITMGLPSGVSMDATLAASTTDSSSWGLFYVLTNASPAFPTTSDGPWPIVSDTSQSAQNLYVSRTVSGSRFAKELGTLIGTGTRFHIEVKGVPIQNWQP